MSIFKEVYGTRCVGAQDPQCPNFVNKKLLPPTKRFCDCAGKVEQMERTNWKTVGIAIAIVVLLAGAGGFAAWSNVPSVGGLFSGNPPGDHSPEGAPAKAEGVSLMLQTASGESVPLDHAFQGGDQFRFSLRGPSSLHLYCFYEDRESHRMKPLAFGSTLAPDQEMNVPGDGSIRLDNHAGPEVFQFIVAHSDVPAFDGNSDLDRSAFDAELKNLKSNGGIATGRFEGRDGGVSLAPDAKGATIAKIELTHR
jgi:hypothetical protein